MLGLFRRRQKLPADRRPALEREERVLAWAVTAAEQTVVATNRGLWLPGLNRLGWHEIHKAVWSGRELQVTPARICEEREGYVVVADQPVVSALLLDPGEVPDHVRTRVTRSVGFTSYHPVSVTDPSSGGVRIAARRVSGVDGLSWTVRYDLSARADSTEAHERTAELVAEARAAAEATAPV